jgi:predicted MPP superfamily phosphohydrolase
VSGEFGWIFRAVALATLVAVPLVAWRVRGRIYAIFGFVLLALSLPGAWATAVRLEGWATAPGRDLALAGFAWGMTAAGYHLLHLVRARLRGRWFRALISVPGQVFLAASFMAGPWQLLLLLVRGTLGASGLEAAVHASRWLDLVPYAVAGVSVATSARHVMEWVRVRLEGPAQPGAAARPGAAQVARVPVERHRGSAPRPLAGRPLRVVQISDPHLGPWQSVRRLRSTIEQLLAERPDLVLLTGDFLTMEGNGSRGALASALEPLRGVSERSFAVFGNHDHEASHEVRSALEASGAQLLVDEEALTQTPAGPVQILGADYVRRGQRERLAQLFARCPRRAGHLRLLLLHDPSCFRYVPDGEVDLTLSGHTHGGQVGLVSLGIDWTVLRGSRWPDHGLFARGRNRLYVHRGTGFYGFPLRVGVPGEASVLELVLE